MCSSQPWCPDGRAEVSLDSQGTCRRACMRGGGVWRPRRHDRPWFSRAHGPICRRSSCARRVKVSRYRMLPHSESDRGDGHAKCGVFGFSVSRFFSLLQVFSRSSSGVAYCTRWMRVKCCTIWFAGVHSIVRHGAAHSHGKEGVRCACSAAH